MNRYATQGRILVRALMRRPHTYLDMLKHGVSCSPWKRVQEALRVHFPECQLVKSRDRAGNTTWRVVKPTRWTA
jgi:hypothetical protein